MDKLQFTEIEIDRMVAGLIEIQVHANQTKLVERLLEITGIEFEPPTRYVLTGGTTYSPREREIEIKLIEDELELAADELKDLERDQIALCDNLEAKAKDLADAEHVALEIDEWWLVSDYLEAELGLRDEFILKTEYGNWWGRVEVDPARPELIHETVLRTIAYAQNFSVHNHTDD